MSSTRYSHYKSISNALSPKEMKNVLGGSGENFRCWCGMGKIAPEDFFDVWAPSYVDALIYVSYRCPNRLGGCDM